LTVTPSGNQIREWLEELLVARPSRTLRMSMKNASLWQGGIFYTKGSVFSRSNSSVAISKSTVGVDYSEKSS